MTSQPILSRKFTRRSEVSGGDKMRHRVTPSYRNSILDSQYQCSGNYTSTEKCCIITAYILINLRNKKSSPSHHWRGDFYIFLCFYYRRNSIWRRLAISLDILKKVWRQCILYLPNHKICEQHHRCIVLTIKNRDIHLMFAISPSILISKTEK